jgi:hypothetical protein
MTTYTGTLNAGQQLKPGDTLTSPNNNYQLVFEANGNLVLYQLNGFAIWATNTAGQTATSAIMQTDGNFVLYANGSTIWSSNTAGNPGAIFRLGDYGNLVVEIASGRVLWGNPLVDLSQTIGRGNQMGPKWDV